MQHARADMLVCNCQKTMAIDGEALAKALGRDPFLVAEHLCRRELARFESAADACAQDGRALLVACTQEAPLFRETLTESEGEPPSVRFVNIRERAGWSEAGEMKTPSRDLTAKMAALLAEANLDVSPAAVVAMDSQGEILVLGCDDAALEATRQLAGRLDATVVLTPEAQVLAPRVMDVAVFCGRLSSARGHLGRFEVTFEAVRAAKPASRAQLEFEGAPQSLSRRADIILDLRGATPLFSAPDKRDGYFFPDRNNPAAVLQALLAATNMVGTFTKPRYVDYDSAICAHARNHIVGCTRCRDNCPTGAIMSDGDRLVYDPYVCAGCGTCASVCPTGAARYALPTDEALVMRARTLLRTYLGAGGARPVLFVHDVSHGDEMIDLMARFGHGLPAHVLPFAVNQVTQIGIDFLLAAAAFGAERIVILVPPRKHDESAALAGAAALAEQLFDGLGYGASRVELIDEADPDAVCARLYALEPYSGLTPAAFQPVGGKREVTARALDHLHGHAPNKVAEIALTAGSPFGTIDLDTGRCTLCMSCVGTCPTGALKDNPAQPQLSFAEDACVQCGLCRNTCPEKAISLSPRLNFRPEAHRHRIVNEDRPFCCARCGKPFGSSAQINRVLERLQSHAMFANAGALDHLKLCQDCRVIVMMEAPEHPFKFGTVPRVRTTADYLRAQESGVDLDAELDAAIERPRGANGKT